MPRREPEPFSKYDPTGSEAVARREARRMIEGKDPDVAARRFHARALLLRSAWIIGTLVLIFGYAIMAILFLGYGSYFHLT